MRVRRAATVAIVAAVLTVSPIAVEAASASQAWVPVSLNCGQQYVEITFHVTTGGSVRVGYASTPQGNYWNGAYWQFNVAGTYTRDPGWHQLTWEKWNSDGDISKWSYKCVSYS